MANERLCQIEIIRQTPERPVVAFFRFFDAEGECVIAFPYRLNRRITHFSDIMVDPKLSVEIDCGDPEARIFIRIKPCGWRYYWGRKLSRFLSSFSRKREPVLPAPDPSCIVPFVAADGIAASSSTPLVSIVIPTRDRAQLLGRAVQTLFEKATWRNLELVIVDNGSVEQETIALFDRLRALPFVTIIRRDERFNFARLANEGIRASRGEIIALLNNDVESDDPDWLTPLAALAVNPRVGVVGVKLLNEDGTVQHAGITLGIRALTGHAGRGRAADDPGPHSLLTTTRSVSAVTGACMLTRRNVFDEIGGFDENFVVECNDVDYCLRAGAAGYAVVYAATPALVHREGSTRQAERGMRAQELFDRALFTKRWGHALLKDPFYPSELTLQDESLALAMEPHDS